MIEIFALFMLGFGIFFCLVGLIGVIRLPDVYSRLHASGKVATLGIFGLLVASALLLPDTALKAIVLLFFLLFSAPVSTHVIALAAYRQGVPMKNSVQDDLRAKQG
jgi:multicomponent Na+:H+ antiporter subunit G